MAEQPHVAQLKIGKHTYLVQVRAADDCQVSGQSDPISSLAIFPVPNSTYLWATPHFASNRYKAFDLFSFARPSLQHQSWPQNLLLPCMLAQLS